MICGNDISYWNRMKCAQFVSQQILNKRPRVRGLATSKKGARVASAWRSKSPETLELIREESPPGQGPGAVGNSLPVLDPESHFHKLSPLLVTACRYYESTAGHWLWVDHGCVLGCSAGSLFHYLSGCGGSLFEQCTVQPVCEGKGTVVFPSKAFDVTRRQVVPVQLRGHGLAAGPPLRAGGGPVRRQRMSATG